MVLLPPCFPQSHLKIKLHTQLQDLVPIATFFNLFTADDTFTSSWPDIKLPEAEVLILNFMSKNYALPQFMEHMNQLKVLIVTNYGFCPAELENFAVVGHLSSLKRIRLEHVSISSTLSCSLAFRLINLQKLSLTMCEIGNVLDNCANMFPHLRDIEMEYCSDLVELPVGICDIIHLEKIDPENKYLEKGSCLSPSLETVLASQLVLASRQLPLLSEVLEVCSFAGSSHVKLEQELA